MFRKRIVAAAVAIAAATFVPAAAWAGGGYHGDHHRGFHGFRGFHGVHGFRGHPRFHGGVHGWRGYHFHRPAYASCWRWIATPAGPTRIWVCR